MTKRQKKKQKSLLFLACMRQIEKGFPLESLEEYMRANGIPQERRNAVMNEIERELLKKNYH